MASSCSKFVSRLSSRLQPSFAFKFNKKNSLSSLTSFCSSSHLPLSARRFSCLSRCDLDLFLSLGWWKFKIFKLVSLEALFYCLDSSFSESFMDRLPLELSCVGSIMPLHSAIASATLVSSLSSESDSWALVPQGVFCACYVEILIIGCI